jgi:hypothetical protein
VIEEQRRSREKDWQEESGTYSFFQTPHNAWVEPDEGSWLTMRPRFHPFMIQ